MILKKKLRDLKKIDLSKSYISLAVVREYKKERVSRYKVNYVQVDEKLENRLRNIVLRKIESSNSIEKYTFDCPEPEADEIRGIESDETDFEKIFDQLTQLNPEEDQIENIDELVKAKSYLIILRDDEGIQVVGFKRIPENWKMKKSKDLISLLYRENMFVDLEEEYVFSISNSIDFLYYDELLFILSKKLFETGLNFREGMKNKAQEFYEDVISENLFTNIDLLIKKVGDNLRYLRKISTINKLGYYKDKKYIENFKKINDVKKWGITFDKNQIVLTEDTIDDVLTVLQNKRLHSDITEEDFDVESVKPLATYSESN